MRKYAVFVVLASLSACQGPDTNATRTAANRASPAPSANRQELYASYCIGVLGVAMNSAGTDRDMGAPGLEASVQDVVSWASAPSGAKSSAATRARLADEHRRLKRLTSYLDATGVFVDLSRPLAVPALQHALETGAQDASQCYATRLHCTMAYSQKLSGPQDGTPTVSAGLASCVANEAACPQAQRCFGSDDLGK
jgi:hypothetical protein